MIENTPIFTSDKNENKINIKNNVDDYIKTRVEIKKKIWRVFKGIVSMKGMNVSDALTEAIVIWLEDIESVKHVCCICDNIVDDDCFRRIINNNVIYYCSIECINK